MARRKGSSAYDAVVSDTLKNLVRQFSQELCFYRELIQNAIDAGSGRVDVECQHADDRAVARVIDYGEGMDRNIIDSQLTRLFSSTKEDDFTKIGKFGIGFVSVFAVNPEAVVVDTGKGGEHWRVLFHPDGRFERIRLDSPVEGTRVEVYVKMKAEAFPEFCRRSRETVKYWCRHTESDIHFNGERINEAFDVDSKVKVQREDRGTLVVAGLSAAEKPLFGFYNQGITLLEGRLAYHEGVTFKIKSRYLEHTLTRDNVKQDQHFDKAMAILADVVHKDLAREVFASLERAAGAEQAQELNALFTLGLPLIRRHWSGLGRDARFIPRLGGPPMSLQEARQAAGPAAKLLKSLGWTDDGGATQTSAAALLSSSRQVLLADGEPSPVVDALGAQKVMVARLSLDSPIVAELERLGLSVRSASRVLAAPPPVPAEQLPPGIPRLASDAIALLASAGVEFLGSSFGRFDYPGSSVAALPFLLLPKAGPLALARRSAALAEDARPAVWPLRLLGRRHLVLNVDHPLVNRLASVHEAHSGTSSYMLAKLICLSDGLHPEVDDCLLRRTLEAPAVG